MAAQTINRASVMAAPASRPQPYLKNDKYKFLGMYGETDDMSGGFGQDGVTAFEKFLESGGTLITTLGAVRFPIEFGFARSVDTENVAGLNAQKPLVQAEIVKTDHPVFYGYADKIIPVKCGQGQQVVRYGIADQDRCSAALWARRLSDELALARARTRCANRRSDGYPGSPPRMGRVLMFRAIRSTAGRTHGEFNMVSTRSSTWNDTTK
jgi:hypothetical protein